MLFTVYKITKLDDGRVYIGVHKTTNINDGYMGSGVHIRAALKKYGRAAFKKEILFVFDTAEEAYAKEKELITPEFLADEQTFNKGAGGSGDTTDWATRNRKILRGTDHPQYGKKRTDEQRRRTSESLKRAYRENPPDSIMWEKTAAKKRGVPSPLKGLTQTAESNMKRSIAHINLEKKTCEICGRCISPQNFSRHLSTHSE